MKRWLLPASALVLVLIACGAGGKSAPRVAKAGARVASVRVIAARRERAAMREATRLLGKFVPPPGARRTGQPRDYAGVLRRSGPGPLGETVDAHRFWSVRLPLKTVIAYLRAHRVRGFERSGATWGTRKPHYLIMTASRSSTRFLTVTSVGLARRTLIRVDVQVAWTYPRSPSERVPSRTSQIDLRAPKVSQKVSDRATVAKIVRWFDALPISPPGIAVPCPAGMTPDIRLSFRDARGVRLAQATLPPTFAWICSSIAFTIGGRAQQPLIDRPHSESFVRRLQQLLGVHLLRTHH
jgi:hypothetical protein